MNKRTARRTSVLAGLTFALMLAGQNAKAQTPVYHPGDVIPISVTFTGPDAGEITGAAINLATSGNAPANQTGFLTQLYSQDSHQAGHHTFVVSLRIPPNQASGDYKVLMVRVLVGNLNNLTVDYNSSEFRTTVTYTIENPRHFIKPAIKEIH